jgi:glyoxylate reductase
VLPKVHVTRRVQARALEELRASFDLTFHDGEWPPERAEVLGAARGVDGLLVMANDPVDSELLDTAGPQLRIVANHAVGYENVDLEAATHRGVIVTNTPSVLTRATAELTLALILDVLRRVSEGDRFLRSRTPWIWSPTFFLGTGLAGKTIGIVGLGRIGRDVAGLAQAFDMEVVYTSRCRATDVSYPRLDLDELLRTADVVSLHCPLTAETRHLIDADALGAMRPTAVLVNTTRGPVVDEAALAWALKTGQIAGAGLDVYEHEPEVHPDLLELENVVLAPHLGSATFETRDAMGLLCVEALRAVLLEDRCPENALNPEALAVRA